MKTKIALPENFDTLSAEEKIKFFTEFEYDDFKEENTRLKSSFDKTSSELATLKKEKRDKLTEDEKAKADREEHDKALMEELESLRSEKRVSSYAKKLMEVGFDSETASKMAQGLPEGIGDEFFAMQRTFLESKSQQIKEEALKSQPQITSGQRIDPEIQKKAEEENKLRKYAGLI